MDIKVNMNGKTVRVEQIIPEACAFGMCVDPGTHKFQELMLCEPHADYMAKHWGDESKLPVTKQS